MKRSHFVIVFSKLKELLGLPGENVVKVWVEPDNDYLHVMTEGDGCRFDHYEGMYVDTDMLPSETVIHPPTDNEEFVPGWDVARDKQGHPITITLEQSRAIWHAIGVVEAVRRSENQQSLWDNAGANLGKSRLLGRMLFEGKPPTRTKPPFAWGGPAWGDLPGGDPFK